MRNKRNCILTAAVLSSLAMPLSYALAAEPATEDPYLATEYSVYGRENFAELKFMKKDYGIGDGSKNKENWLVDPANYDLDDELITATVAGTDYWTNILAPKAENTTLWQIFVTTFDEQNAEAYSPSIDADGKTEIAKSSQDAAFYLGEQLQEGKVFTPLSYTTESVLPKGKYTYSEIWIGEHYGAKRKGAEDGWWIDAETALPTNEQAADFVGMFRHELGHALGMLFITKKKANAQKVNEYFVDENMTDKLSWTLHVRDQNGKPAQAGLQIVDTKDATDPAKNYFVVDREITADGKGYAYFYGKHVTEALDGAKFFGRSALPVNGWEPDSTEKNKKVYKFEGSHLQTAGMMSHRPYSNYTSLMEVELAVMQDLGYSIDRKAFFGRSIYGNGGSIVNNQGYFKRNAKGTAYLDHTYSLEPLGVGLHIYGSDNKVTQNADIMTKGTGAVGVRVDGTGNTLIVPKETEIHADGKRGNGLLIAYGRNHTVEQAGTVTAGGELGTGARFDFGSSSNGARDEYRGSYIRYKRKLSETGEIIDAENLVLNELDVDSYNANKDELNGPLVENYNLSGTLVGGKDAIYISKNAFVKNININKGAEIQGNITSAWKQFGTEECEGAYDKGKNRTMLYIQYNNYFGDNAYHYDVYIPEQVTNLNFNTDMSYSGNITGEDNMKMKVNAGTLTYEGASNVVNVQVAKDATLLDGTYTVNDMSDRQSADFAADTTTGQFINHGTIGASAADRNMTINGTLVSDGRLQAYGSGENGRIIVKGAAKIDGSTVTAREMMPGESKTVLTAQSISGTIANADTAVPVSSMISAKGKITDNNTLSVEMTAANNLGSTDEVVNNACNTVINMYDSMGEEKFQQGELRKLFHMEPEAAARSLTDISSPNAVQGMSMAQTSTVTSHILSARLAEAYAMKNMAVHVPVAKLADDQQSTADEGLKLQAKVDQPVDNDIWFKTAKNWGELKGGANYHGTTFALGYDKAAGKNWRVGGFVSYGRSSFAAGSAGSKVQDTRFGLYGGCKSGPHEGYVYLSHGWLKNDLSRGISGFGTAKADYNSHILELGGEYKYDLQANKAAAWHVSPYVNMQLSRLWQDGYTESGVGALGQRVNSAGNTYFATGLGMEFKRYLNKGSYAMRLGLRHAFSGANPRVTFGLAGGGSTAYEMCGQQDKTHMVMSICGESEFSPGWTLAGDAMLKRGSHDRDIMCAVTLRRMW